MHAMRNGLCRVEGIRGIPVLGFLACGAIRSLSRLHVGAIDEVVAQRVLPRTGAA
jgi:hypothetical protein